MKSWAHTEVATVVIVVAFKVLVVRVHVPNVVVVVSGPKKAQQTKKNKPRVTLLVFPYIIVNNYIYIIP